MASSRAAQRYAKALLDLAEERNNQEAINKDIRDIHKTLEASGELRSVLKSPVIDVNAKVNSLKAIFKSVSEDVKNLFSVLANNNRIAELNLVTKKYIELYDEKKKLEDKLKICKKWIYQRKTTVQMQKMQLSFHPKLEKRSFIRNN